MNLAGFIDTFKEAIAKRVVESYPPLYRPSEKGLKLPRLLRTPMGGQEDAIKGAALSLQAHRGTTVVGEMGTGKTFIAAAAAAPRSLLRTSLGSQLAAPAAVMKWATASATKVPEPQAGSSTRWFSGASTSSRIMERTSHVGV